MSSSASAPAPARWVPSHRHVEDLPRISARRLLGQQPVATSFASLQALLEAGRQVVLVQPHASPGERAALAVLGGGPFHNRTALVAEINANRLVLVRTHLFRRQEIVLTEADVRRIHIIDSTKNGVWLGLAAGGALGIVEILQVRRESRSGSDCNMCPLGYAIGAVIPLVGAGIGGMIDGAINEAIYRQPAGDRRVTLGPVLRRAAVGIIAEIRF